MHTYYRTHMSPPHKFINHPTLYQLTGSRHCELELFAPLLVEREEKQLWHGLDEDGERDPSHAVDSGKDEERGFVYHNKDCDTCNEQKQTGEEEERRIAPAREARGCQWWQRQYEDDGRGEFDGLMCVCVCLFVFVCLCLFVCVCVCVCVC